MMEKNKKILITLGVIAVLLLIIVLILIFTNKTYTVTFDSKGGTEVTNQTVRKNETAIEPENPIKEGYTFLGWYTDEESNIKYDFNTKVEKDITLIAKWEANKEKITKIDIIANEKELTINDEISLDLKVIAGAKELEADKLEIDWSSSDEEIATVTQKGKVKALKAGTVTITVTIDGVKSEIELTVKAKEEQKEEDKKPTNNNNTNNKKPSTSKPNNTGNNNNTKPEEENKPSKPNKPTVTYTYTWVPVQGSVAGEYMLYIVDSNGKKVSGTATLTELSGNKFTVSIPANGVKYVKQAITSVTNIKAN